VRVAILSKALVVGAYQTKLQEIAARGDLDLVAIVPPAWRDGARLQRLELLPSPLFLLLTTPFASNGRFHWHWYPRLPRLLADLRPDLLHIDEEPYNLATYLALRAARRVGARTLFFSWQNIRRDYPLPFRLMERYCYTHADAAIAGTPAAAEVLRAKGYVGTLAVIPQFGVDPAAFCPRPHPPTPGWTVGYAGRLVEEKGLHVLLAALERLGGDWRLAIAGSGPLREEILEWSARRGYVARLDLRQHVPSREMPAFLAALDALVLPSLTRPNWKEQFGRVLVEAMACGVPVVGSDSGEIPAVVGDAGLIFREGDADALAALLDRLRRSSDLQRDLAAAGRQRVLAHYTQARIAEQTVDLYRRVLGAV